MILQLGNPAPAHDVVVGSDEQITYVDFPEGISVDEAFVTVTDVSGVWAAQSLAAGPSWVACSDSDLEARLCAFYSCSPLAVPGLNA